MNKKTFQETTSLLADLNNDTLEAEVVQSKSEDPVNSLKLAIYSFFKARLNKIGADDDLQGIVEQKLREKIAKDEVSVTQLIGLQRALKSESTTATNSILEILKPVPNASSFMDVTMVTKSDKSDFGELQASDAAALKKLTQLVLAYKSEE